MRYMLLIYMEENAMDQAQREHCYQESGQLAHELNRGGQFVSAAPLQPVSTATTVQVRTGKRLVMDGPFAEMREQLGGYFMIEAKDLDEAIGIAGRIPGARVGSVEIRPVIEVEGLPGKAAATDDESEIRALIDRLHRAHYRKDADGVAALYAEDAAVFNLAPPLAHRGVDRREKQAWLDSWEGPVEVEGRDVHITVSGDLAFCHAFFRLSGKKTGVEQRICFWMRETLCLERSGGAWRIVHEHTSVPFYMDGSLRPAFDLQPAAEGSH